MLCKFTNGYVNSTVSSSGAVLGNGWDAFGSLSYVDFNGNRNQTDQELFLYVRCAEV